MTITAKFNGECKACGKKIRKGETIQWERGAGARHIACSGRPESAQEDYPCTDRGYEDQCAAACGFDRLDRY